MFTLNSKLNSRLSAKEDLRLDYLCDRFDIDIKDITVLRNSGLSWHNNVACFSILHPNTIYICADKDIESLLPFIVHEAVHRKQFKRWSILYVVLAFPLWRRWTIEPNAYREEDRINNLMGG